MAGPVASHLPAAAPLMPAAGLKRCSHCDERGNRPDELRPRLSWTSFGETAKRPQGGVPLAVEKWTDAGSH
jgi:hypothetical protein